MKSSPFTLPLSIHTLILCTLFTSVTLSQNITADKAGTVSDTLQDSVTHPQDSTRAADTSGNSDTLSNLHVGASGDSSLQIPSSSDTTLRPWHLPTVGIGVGWTLGTMPVFDLWQEGLLEDPLDVDSLKAQRVSYTVKEEPNIYHSAFPLKINFVPLADSSRFLSIEIVSLLMTKKFIAAYQTDSLKTLWETDRHFLFYSLSAGARYHLTIDSDLFSISRFEQSYFSVGFQVVPLSIIREKSTVIFDGSVRGSRKIYWGMGCAWQTGLCMFRKLSEHASYSVGLGYNGWWFGNFREEDYRVRRGSINPFDPQALDYLSFFTHRFAFSVTVMFNRKIKQPVTQPAPQSVPPIVPEKLPDVIPDSPGPDGESIQPPSSSAPNTPAP